MDNVNVRVWDNCVSQKIRVGQSIEGNFHYMLYKAGCGICHSVESILWNLLVVTGGAELHLSVATVKELTGKDSATLEEVYNAIKIRGGDLCPAEVGPRLCLCMGKGREMLWLKIAMNPITDSSGDQKIFCIGWFNEGDRKPWIRTLPGCLQYPCEGHWPIVYVSSALGLS